MNKINLANLPTKIVRLDRISKEYGKNIYLKRDDLTGLETSGNKIRKLEFSIAEALNNGHDTIITMGAIQSNHCRATASVCARLGLKCHLLLKGQPDDIGGNLFLDYIFGANIHFIDDKSSIYKEAEKLSYILKNKGDSPYIIPIGASNPIGTYGYVNAYEEILEQEKDLGIQFDLISVAIGSGGTYGGLWYGNYINKNDKRILGFSVSETKQGFKSIVIDILKGLDQDIKSFDSLDVNESYIGEGYAIARDEELEFYYEIGKQEGIVFDPCYTGKAFRGLLNEVKKGNIKEKNILFIHTGGLMGWTSDYMNRLYEIANQKQT